MTENGITMLNNLLLKCRFRRTLLLVFMLLVCIVLNYRQPGTD